VAGSLSVLVAKGAGIVVLEAMAFATIGGPEFLMKRKPKEQFNLGWRLGLPKHGGS